MKEKSWVIHTTFMPCHKAHSNMAGLANDKATGAKKAQKTPFGSFKKCSADYDAWALPTLTRSNRMAYIKLTNLNRYRTELSGLLHGFLELLGV